MANIFYNAIRQDIAIVQGDTMSFGFRLKGLEGQTPSSIYFTCKETIESETPLFQVSDTNNIHLDNYDEDTDTYTYTVRIPPHLTKTVPLGRYFYDLEFEVNGDTFTLMKGRFAIEYEITTEHYPIPPIYEDGDSVKYPVADISPTLKMNYTSKPISDIAGIISKIDNPVGSNTFTTAEMVTELRSDKAKIDDIKDTCAIAIADWGYTPTLSETQYLVGTFETEFNQIRNAIYNANGVWEDNYNNLAEQVGSILWQGTQAQYDALQTINPNTLYIILES